MCKKELYVNGEKRVYNFINEELYQREIQEAKLKLLEEIGLYLAKQLVKFEIEKDDKFTTIHAKVDGFFTENK